MVFANFKDMEFWQANRRKLLKVLALTSTLSLVDLFSPFKQVGFGKEGNMTPEEMREKAIRLFKKPTLFQCSQATLVVGQEKLGRKDWEVVRAMEAFAGGLGANGEVCGALIGALAVMGLRFGRGGEEEKFDRRMWGYTRQLPKRFREEIVPSHGGIRCREIAGVDWTKPEQVQSFYNGEKFLECTRIVGDTAKLIGELLERET